MYDAFITEKYEDKKNGQAQSPVLHGSASPCEADKGGFDLKVPAGMSISGTVHVRAAEESVRKSGTGP